MTGDAKSPAPRTHTQRDRAPLHARRTGQPAGRQPIDVPVAESASVTGWKNVSPPEVQSPLPPDVSPIALLPENSEPPLSPGSAQTSVWISPFTMSPLP